MTPQSTPEGPGYPGGQGPNPNSLFRAPIDVGFDLQSTFLAKMSGFRDYPQISRFRTHRNQGKNIY